MDQLIAVMNAAAAGLILMGIVVAARSFSKAESKVRTDRAELERIFNASTELDEQQRQLDASGIRFTSWNDIRYLNQDIQLAAMERAKPSLSAAFVLTMVGALFVFVAALLSF